MIGATVRYRPWQPGDDALLAALGPALSEKSLYTRFLIGTPTIPGYYLHYVRNAPRSRWDAVVALHGDDVVGWAEFGRMEYYGAEAELAVVVVDAWQRRGIGTAVARRAVERAILSGVTTLSAEVLASNIASARLIESLSGGVHSLRSDGQVLHYRLPLREVAVAA
ncbi:MAG TPA: GNAT family N-acetyltransferase [Nocardioidaceae bacterium]|nr:GNAT family N-acetyltransferase [Nocardioidaceae bacterium]